MISKQQQQQQQQLKKNTDCNCVVNESLNVMGSDSKVQKYQ